MEEDAEVYLKAIKLMVFYGNKQDYNWASLEEMNKMLTDADFEDTDEDYSQKMVYATIYFMPEAMRKAVLSKLNKIEEQAEETLDQELDLMAAEGESAEPTEEGSEKKN